MTDERIIKFFRKHHVLTIATCSGNEPWCANCFYVYLPEENILVFTTDHDTRHGREFLINNLVAGTVVLETPVIGKIRGIQFQGLVSEPKGDLYEKVRSAYLKRFPVAMLMETHLWIVELTYIKMTDNRLGFGKKLIWKKEQENDVRLTS
ncbi:MAG: pyridoxamine 5'-phosphate oxidase family protein [Bacteroidales bacterium]|nr:pyridoxamine 5'-phosphate oxidase family protein [Bacteroidales bacterium]